MEVAPIKPIIPFDMLEKVDIRVGTIEHVDDVRDADKLVKLTVDCGDHKGMLLDIGYADGITPVLAMPEKPVPNGTRAGKLRRLAGRRCSSSLCALLHEATEYGIVNAEPPRKRQLSWAEKADTSHATLRKGE